MSPAYGVCVQQLRFVGAIAGVGTASGVRFVVGRWSASPFGAFADVMVEDAAGHRTLLAPTAEVAEFVCQTYTFDEVHIGPVEVDDAVVGWTVDAGDQLGAQIVVGSRTPLGWLLRAVPRPLATRPAWASVVDPAARVVMPGVRTRGTARPGRREWYGATDLTRITAVEGRWRGSDLGALRDVEPPCQFGFSSTPRTPCITDVVTTISLDAPD